MLGEANSGGKQYNYKKQKILGEGEFAAAAIPLWFSDVTQKKIFSALKNPGILGRTAAVKHYLRQMAVARLRVEAVSMRSEGNHFYFDSSYASFPKC